MSSHLSSLSKPFDTVLYIVNKISTTGDGEKTIDCFAEEASICPRPDAEQKNTHERDFEEMSFIMDCNVLNIFPIWCFTVLSSPSNWSQLIILAQSKKYFCKINYNIVDLTSP